MSISAKFHRGIVRFNGFSGGDNFTFGADSDPPSMSGSSTGNAETTPAKHDFRVVIH